MILNRSLVHWQVYHHYYETVRFFVLSALNSGKLLSLESFRKHSMHRRDTHRLLLDTRNTLYHSLCRIQAVSYRDQGSTDQNQFRFRRFGRRPGTGQGPENFRNLGPDQVQQNFENLGPIRTGRYADLAVQGSLIEIMIFYILIVK